MDLGDLFSGKRKLAIIVGTLVLLSPLLYDCQQKLRRAGIYRKHCEGEILKTRRTLTGLVDVVDCSGSRRENQHRRRKDRTYDHRGHYVARIADSAGETYNVSISGNTHRRAIPGQYLICRGSQRDVYPSKEAADRARKRRREQLEERTSPLTD
ncbi:MAG: hypothetical protein JRH20_05985 [Deltaproteobacteria bacterium]|nr:hypothetical protein [Deltaproteobacteria bacterium]